MPYTPSIVSNPYIPDTCQLIIYFAIITVITEIKSGRPMSSKNHFMFSWGKNDDE